jgi:broad specificity phosphatase PhoE
MAYRPSVDHVNAAYAGASGAEHPEVRARVVRAGDEKAMTERLILCRHAESTVNVDSIVNGDPRAPSPLTERGRRQAAELGRRLRPRRVELVATSEFERARATAAGAFGGAVPELVIPELNDPLLGSLEGRPLATYLEWLRAHDPARRAPGGGESQVDAVARYCRAFDLLAGRPERVVAAICHSLPVAVALRLASGLDPAFVPEYEGVAQAVPHEIEVAALRAGVRRARRELAGRARAGGAPARRRA